jgi:hypothetical protein
MLYKEANSTERVETFNDEAKKLLDTTIKELQEISETVTSSSNEIQQNLKNFNREISKLNYNTLLKSIKNIFEIVTKKPTALKAKQLRKLKGYFNDARNEKKTWRKYNDVDKQITSECDTFIKNNMKAVNGIILINLKDALTYENTIKDLKVLYNDKSLKGSWKDLAFKPIKDDLLIAFFHNQTNEDDANKSSDYPKVSYYTTFNDADKLLHIRCGLKSVAQLQSCSTMQYEDFVATYTSQTPTFMYDRFKKHDGNINGIENGIKKTRKRKKVSQPRVLENIQTDLQNREDDIEEQKEEIENDKETFNTILKGNIYQKYNHFDFSKSDVELVKQQRAKNQETELIERIKSKFSKYPKLSTKFNDQDINRLIASNPTFVLKLLTRQYADAKHQVFFVPRHVYFFFKNWKDGDQNDPEFVKNKEELFKEINKDPTTFIDKKKGWIKKIDHNPPIEVPETFKEILQWTKHASDGHKLENELYLFLKFKEIKYHEDAKIIIITIEFNTIT